MPSSNSPRRGRAAAIIALALAMAAAAIVHSARHLAPSPFGALSFVDTSLHDLAVRLPPTDTANARSVLSHDPPAVRATAAQQLAWDTSGAAVPFTLALVMQERDPEVARRLAQAVPYESHLINDPRTPGVLAAAIRTAPLAAVPELSRALQHIVLMTAQRGVSARVAAGEPTSDSVRRALLDAEDRAVVLQHGLMLPTFLRRPPPVFEKHVRDRSSIRVLAFGDWGFRNSTDETKIATAVRAYHARRPFDLGITLGDNFYVAGMPSPDDPRWATEYEPLYGALGIELFATLGNHDEYDPDSPAAEILYSRQSTTWRMPAEYYTFTAGPVQFVVIDSNTLPESTEQREWLRATLSASSAAWKVVYGHHAPYVAYPGTPRLEDTSVSHALMPILTATHTDMYLAGHHHSLEHLKPVQGVNLFIVAGGGASLYDVDEHSPAAYFARSTYGFSVLEATAHTFTVRFVDETGREVYAVTLRK